MTTSQRIEEILRSRRTLASKKHEILEVIEDKKKAAFHKAKCFYSKNDA